MDERQVRSAIMQGFFETQGEDSMAAVNVAMNATTSAALNVALSAAVKPAHEVAA